MISMLLVYDRPSGRIVSQRIFDSSAEALQARFALEAEDGRDYRREIVVLTATDVATMKRTHSRYFSEELLRPAAS
ncbi:MAG: hypothetical protein U0Q15_08505 [Kineosporiaceae bacterium]